MLLTKLCKVNKGKFGKIKKGQFFCQTNSYKKGRWEYIVVLNYSTNPYHDKHLFKSLYKIFL
jgi:hypothetical protein